MTHPDLRTADWSAWSMPRGVLRIVAAAIALCAVAGFVLGIQGAPEKGRLPGEAPQQGSAAQLQALDAKPLADETPPPPPPEKKKPEEEKKEEVDPNDAAAVIPVPPPVVQPAKPATADDKVGDLLDGVTPPPQEDPPH